MTNTKIQWPQNTRVQRRDDMSSTGRLTLILERDGDLVVNICTGSTEQDYATATVEFCAGGSGGGRSPRTREALIALMVAMEADNAERPIPYREDNLTKIVAVVDKEAEERAAQLLMKPDQLLTPADATQRVLTDGSPVTADHREIDPATGQQKAYVVLSEEERAKGFVRPVRYSYLHEKCRTVTTISKAIAETYARYPSFYTGTFCICCKEHFLVGETGQFVWEGTKEKVGT